MSGFNLIVAPDNRSLAFQKNSRYPASNRSLYFPFVHHNKLMAAASKLFIILAQLDYKTSILNISQFQHDFMREIEIFRLRAHALGYDDQSISLCGQALQWCVYFLLKPLYPEEAKGFNPEQPSFLEFFNQLENLQKQSTQSIDPVELIYVCLSISLPSSSLTEVACDQVMERLYQRIQTERGEFQKTLSPSMVKKSISSPSVHEKRYDKMHLLRILGLTGFMIFSMYIGVEYLLSLSSHQIRQDLTTLVQPISEE